MFYQRLYRHSGSGFSEKPYWFLESIILFKLLVWFSEHECYRKEVILLFSDMLNVFMLLSALFFSELWSVWGCKVPLEMVYFTSSPQGVLPKAGHPDRFPVRFGMSPRLKTTQPLWTTYASAWHPSQWKDHLLWCAGGALNTAQEAGRLLCHWERWWSACVHLLPK